MALIFFMVQLVCLVAFVVCSAVAGVEEEMRTLCKTRRCSSTASQLDEMIRFCFFSRFAHRRRSPVHFGRQLRRLRAAEVLPHRPVGQLLQPPAQPDHRLNPRTCPKHRRWIRNTMGNNAWHNTRFLSVLSFGPNSESSRQQLASRAQKEIEGTPVLAAG